VAGREHVLAIDVGTQSARAALVDRDLRIADSQATPLPLFTPRPGWAEQEPEGLWAATASSVAGLLERNRDAVVEAVGVGAQMHGVVPVGGDGRPLVDRVGIWSDKRAAGLVDRFAARPDAAALAALAGNPPLPSWSGFKLAWIREEQPDVHRRAAAFLVVKDFVNLRLTGVPATDPTEASGSFLVDAGTRAWSPALIEALGLSREGLPDLAESTAVIGRVSAEAAGRTGLRAGTPVVCGAGDMLCQLLVAGIGGPGRVGEVSGTASIVAAWDEQPAGDPRVMNLRALPSGWVRFGIADAGGVSLRWLAGLLGAAGYEELAGPGAGVPPGSRGLVFLPYLLGERTLGSSASRASFVGLTPAHGPPELLRAVLEGTCFELRRALDLIAGGPAAARAIRVTGGGASSPLWNRIRADVYRLPVRPLRSAEGGLLGAGLLAGAGAGWFDDVARAADDLVPLAAEVAPEPTTADLYDRLYAEFQALHDLLDARWPAWGRWEPDENARGAR
jgi:xylulokinase